ncbi:MAG TPA: hypothetical protein VFY29_02330 [Terriglobia bacterium]|nr:hypothetical protein [Terriglobia bacterium]
MKRTLTVLFVALLCLGGGLADAQKTAPDQCEWQRAGAAGITEGIIGTWKLSLYACAFTGVRPIDRDLRVTFNKDQSVSLSEGSKVIATGKWALGSQGRLEFTSLSAVENGAALDRSLTQYFAGFVSFCDSSRDAKRVRFNQSYNDGCDKTFERIDAAST